MSSHRYDPNRVRETGLRTSRGAVYRRLVVVGYDGSNKVCDLCGKASGLRGTVVLHDVDSTDADSVLRYGSDCAAKATNSRDVQAVTYSAMRKQARADLKESLNKEDGGISKIVAYLKRRDPSGRLKYIEWEVYIYRSNQARETEIADIVDLFHKYGSQLVKKDLGQYEYTEFTDLRDQLYAIRDRVSAREKKVEERFRLSEAPEYDVVLDNDRVRVCVIKNKAASVSLGLGTKWCITEKSAFHYEDYDKSNVVFVFILNKKLGKENQLYKVAISFQRSVSNEIAETIFWNAMDEQIEESVLRSEYGLTWYDIKEAAGLAAVARPKSLLARVGAGEASEDDYRTAYVEGIAQKDSVPRRVRLISLMGSKNVPIDILMALSKDKDEHVRARVAEDKNTPQSILLALANDKHGRVRQAVAWNLSVSPETIQILAEDTESYVRSDTARILNASSEILSILSEDDDVNVREGVSWNKNTKIEVLSILAKDEQVCVRQGVAQNRNASPETLQILAGDQNEFVRLDVACNTSSTLSILQTLAEDPDSDVRKGVACNLAKRSLHQPDQDRD